MLQDAPEGAEVAVDVALLISVILVVFRDEEALRALCLHGTSVPTIDRRSRLTLHHDAVAVHANHDTPHQHNLSRGSQQLRNVKV